MSEAEKRLGAAERDFIHAASINFLTPLRNFLEGDWKTISVRGLGPLPPSHPGSPFPRAAEQGSPPALGTQIPWGLPRRGSCGLLLRMDDLPSLGLSFLVLTRWPPRPVLPWPRVSPGGPAPHCSCSHPQKERRLLQNRRLDLDVCKARLKKAKAAEAKAAVGAPAGPPCPALGGAEEGC